MKGRKVDIPIIFGCFGLLLGLMVGEGLEATFEISMIAGPKGPALGGVVGLAFGLYLVWVR